VTVAITILGCGSSGGVPRLAQGWGACDPNNSKNRRRRCSILIERGHGAAKTNVLVDMSPDLRAQLLEAEVNRLDAILLTHSHADHTHGIDDVRPLVIAARRRIDVHMDEPTSQIVRRNFAYIFDTPPGSQYPPLLNEMRLEPGLNCRIDGPGGAIEVMPFRLEHGEIDALGFRLGDCAYTPDVCGVPPESVAYLEGLDLWIVDALRYTRHPTHWSLSETLDWIAKVKPRRAIVTNMHTDLDFERLRTELPSGVEPAFDGMRITVDVP
jgi:phosphoribosyl 1,2-cyclic phosphate phosphodiesterase